MLNCSFDRLIVRIGGLVFEKMTEICKKGRTGSAFGVFSISESKLRRLADFECQKSGSTSRAGFLPI